jgi:3-hydroxybutyryl-CoA dehydrogenase
VACLANEAAFALAEGAATAADIDLAMRLGTRYPRGPLAWAAEIGLDHVLHVLDALHAEHGEGRYRAAPLLRRSVTAGRQMLSDV